MQIAITNGALSLTFSAFGTVTVAVLVLLLGGWVKKKVPFCQKYCLPAPVIGGVIFALVNLILHQTGIVSITLATAYQNDFQFMFFTIVGFGASIALLKRGGGKLIKYFLLVGLLIVGQSVVGVFASDLAHVPRIFGILCGPASLAGGHGSVAAYGQMLEDMGYTGSLVVGMAAATFGLITGSLFGGPLADRLIRKNNLKNTDLESKLSDVQNEAAEITSSGTSKSVNVQSIFVHIAVIGIFMTLGNYLGNILGSLTGVSLPGFVGPMIIAFIARNLNERIHFININDAILDKMSAISLGIFLSMVMISLHLWELFALALPMMIILGIELVFTLLFIYFVVFRVMGKDFDSAVMCSGLTGHGLGATPNGIANMESMSEKYGVSKLAFLIVPIVGGFLQDIFLVPINVFLINWLGK